MGTAANSLAAESLYNVENNHHAIIAHSYSYHRAIYFLGEPQRIRFAVKHALYLIFSPPSPPPPFFYF